MKTTVEFIEAFVNIEKIDNDSSFAGQFGYYPFALVAEKDGEVDVNSLLLGGDVAACYKRFRSYLESGSNYIHMAVDFPAAGDIKQDFVAVFCYQRGLISVIAIPYDTKTGEQGEYIKQSQQLLLIEQQFRHVTGRLHDVAH